MNITITVDEVTLDTVVAKVFGYDEDGDTCETGERTVADLVVEQIVAKLVADNRYPTLRDTVAEIRKEEIRNAVRPSIEEAISRPIRKTNHFGEPTGEVTTLSEFIADEARKQLTEPADRYSREKGTLLQQTVRAEVRKAFESEIAEAVKQARDAVTKELGDQIASQVADAVRKGVAAR